MEGALSEVEDSVDRLEFDRWREEEEELTLRVRPDLLLGLEVPFEVGFDINSDLGLGSAGELCKEELCSVTSFEESKVKQHRQSHRFAYQT